MRQLFSKADLRSLSSILAVLILLGSSPLSVGVAVGPGPNHPEITENICQPMQTADAVSNALLARPAAITLESMLFEMGTVTAHVAVQLIDYRVPPDTPPPKLLAC